MSRFPLALGLAVLALIALTGCSQIIPMTAADDANNPGCAAVIVRLPDTVGDMPKRETDAQATAAWGNPASVLVRCGVEVPRASTLPCIELEGIFFLRDVSDKKFWKFTTFGRDPALDIVVSRKAFTSPGIPLNDLLNAVSFLPPNGQKCTSTDDTVTGQDIDLPPVPTTAPSPTPAG
ncbi:MAG TPA: DUF3515 family protein [Pseudolysinimonas sp.]|nr:DUF3515 family protein [Pseudolysinimonas sp.]